MEWHGHNDFHKAMINATTAWLYGCAAANSTLLGIGERTGNPPIEGLILEYIALKGDTNGIDTTIITDIAEYFEKVIGVRIPSNYPFIGAEFNVTMAGIHADGLIKSEEIYNIFDTRKILKRPIKATINDKSGNAGIAFWINQHLNLKEERALDKRHPGVSKINKRIMELYEAGRVTSMSSDEMDRLVRKYIPELFMSELDRIKLKASEAAVAVVKQVIEHPVMKTMQPDLQEPVMQKCIEENPSIQFAYVVDLNGKKITRNITNIVDRAKYENYGVGTDSYLDREWFIKPLQSGKVHVTEFYISKMTGALCITVSAPIVNESDDMVSIFGVDIKFEDWVKRAEDMAEATQIALKSEYEAKSKSEWRP
jgi:hypothetical protein